MERTFFQKHCYLAVVLLGILCAFLSACGVIILQIARGSENVSYIIRASVVIISALIGIFIMKKSRFTLKEYGFCRPDKGSALRVCFYIPLIFMELITVTIDGFSTEKGLITYGVIALCTFGIGLNEEIYFRGLIFKFISQKGTKKAILISSLIFGMCHIGNYFGGQDIVCTLIQVCFAFLIGVVFAEIVTISKSLWGAIIFHMLQDFITFNTRNAIDTKKTIIIIIEVTVLIVYAICLWRKLIERKIL